MQIYLQIKKQVLHLSHCNGAAQVQNITNKKMTTAQLSQRIIADRTSSYGHYKITIQYRGKQYSCTTTDSMAYDRYNDEDAQRGVQIDALKSLWNECKRKNNLY